MSIPSIELLDQLLGDLNLPTPVPGFDSADILNNPLDIPRSYLAQLLVDIVKCEANEAYNSIQLPSSVDGFRGDLIITVPKLSRAVGIDGNVLRRKLISDVRLSSFFFAFTWIANGLKFPRSPLFQPPIPDDKVIRIFIGSSTYARIILPFICDRGSSYGRLAPGTSQAKLKVVIDFSSPNIVADLTGKHFRSTLLGAQISGAYEAEGWDVTRLNYLGDWGKPMGLLGAGFERLGSESMLQSDPVGHLRTVYQHMSDLVAPELAASKKARDEKGTGSETSSSAETESKGIFAERNLFFSRLENGNHEAVRLWKRFRDACVEDYQKLYSRLGVTFDEYTGESQASIEAMSMIEQKLGTNGISEMDDSSIIVQLQNHGGKHGIARIRDRSGSSTYLLRELASAVQRERQYNFDKMLYVVSADQHTHFQQLIKILELIGMQSLAAKLQHVPFSDTAHLPGAPDQNKSLNEMLNACDARIQETLTAHADLLAGLKLSAKPSRDLTPMAILAQSSQVKRSNELSFELEKLSMIEPSGGLRLSYWISTLSLALSHSTLSEDQNAGSDEYLEDDDNGRLLRLLAHYPAVVRASFRATEPSLIMSYLLNVMDQIDACFEETEGVRVESPSHRRFLEAVRTVLENGSSILGITKQVNS